MSQLNDDTDFTERYNAGKSYTGGFAPISDGYANEIDVHIDCACGSSFDVYGEYPIKCIGCERIYRVDTLIEVGNG